MVAPKATAWRDTNGQTLRCPTHRQGTDPVLWIFSLCCIAQKGWSQLVEVASTHCKRRSKSAAFTSHPPHLPPQQDAPRRTSADCHGRDPACETESVKIADFTGTLRQAPDTPRAFWGDFRKPRNYLSLQVLTNTPDRIRTCNPRFRRPMLYPIELRAPLPSQPRSTREDTTSTDQCKAFADRAPGSRPATTDRRSVFFLAETALLAHYVWSLFAATEGRGERPSLVWVI